MRRKKIFRPSSLRPPTIDHRSLSSVGGPPTFPPSHLSTFHLPTESQIKNPKSKILTPLTPPRPLRGRAFSLVELLAVVGIIALVSVAAVPVMRGLGGSQSSRATAQILVSALEQARTAAILSGTNAYLVILQDTNPYPRSYGIVRQPVDLDGNGRDDFQTNASSTGWVALSKWERLPGDLVFSTNHIGLLPKIDPLGLPLPSGLTIKRGIGFFPSGGLTDEAGTNGLLFAPFNRIANNTAPQADRIEVSFYSGRVRYTGLTKNVNPF